MTREALLEVEGLTKAFRKRTHLGRRIAVPAVRGVGLSIRRNSIFGLVGESGCGKTTLARMIMGLEPADAGRIVYNGYDIAGAGSRRGRGLRKDMQIVLQDSGRLFNPRMRIRGTLREALRRRSGTSAEMEGELARLMAVVGLPADALSRFPHEFSGGQRQRINIARALAVNPKFLILDEPVSNLDVSIQAQIVNLLLDVKRELSLTYLFISHDLALVAYLCDVIAVMHGGRIVERASTEELISTPMHPYTRRLFDSVQGWDGAFSPLGARQQLGAESNGHFVAPDDTEGD